MVIIILLILVFIIYNIKNIQLFTNPILSPNIIRVKRSKGYLEITFERNPKDSIEPGDDFFYEIFYKKEDEIFEVEKNENGELIKEMIDLEKWNVEEVVCDEKICNTILKIDEDNTYYIFILVNRREIRTGTQEVLKSENEFQRSDIQEIIKSENELERSVYPPDILKLVKKNANCDMFFRRSGRDNSIPKDNMKYEIFYTKESEYYPAPVPSPSPSPSPSHDFDDWDKKVVICDKLKCITTIGNLEDEPYLFAIRQIRNGKKSLINKIVKVSDAEPYEPPIYRLEDYQTGFSLDEDTPCEDYSYDDCPDNLTGTILSRCYKDKELDKCLPTE